MTPKSRISWGTLAIEMFSIVIAVGLGFAVTEWREDRQQRARAEDAVESITRELAQNHQELARVAPYYRALAQTLDSLIVDDGDGLLNRSPVPGWRGLSPPVLRRASYSAASSTGALEQVPFESVDRIARAYEVQGSVTLAVDAALRSLIEGRLSLRGEWLRLFSLLSEIAGGAELALAETLASLESTAEP